MNDVVGPFFDRAGLRAWLGWTETRLEELVAGAHVIQLTTADGTEVFPRYQFDDRGTPLPHLPELWPLLAGAYGPWSAAAWLNAPDPDGCGRTAADILRNGDDEQVAAVIREARHDAGRMRF
ncbi:hypothetical protein ACRAWC_01565 [Leifsonia sp. L25]|uniref:hypothetical protein n=1 Tax=Leifsonia sp. L25 TaxID=3423957 RepID=UPI003D68900F